MKKKIKPVDGEKIDQNHGEHIALSLSKIFLQYTPYVNVETYRIDLSVWVPSGSEKWPPLQREVNIHDICPWVHKRRYWGTEKAVCQETEHPPCNEKCEKTWESTCYPCKFYKWATGGGHACEKGIKDRSDCDIPKKDKCSYFREGLCWNKSMNKKCNKDSCERYEGVVARRKDETTYEFSPGLHLFEIKSNQDNYSRLAYQIPNLLPYADYLWLVIGDKKKPPEWVPPWLGLITATEDTFVITQVAQQLGYASDGICINIPNRVWPKGINHRVHRLYKELAVQALFGWKFKGLDRVSKVIEESLKHAKELFKYVVSLEEYGDIGGKKDGDNAR